MTDCSNIVNSQVLVEEFSMARLSTELSSAVALRLRCSLLISGAAGALSRFLALSIFCPDIPREFLLMPPDLPCMLLEPVAYLSRAS